MQVKRIIPSLLLCNGRLVKGSEFINHIDAGNPVTTLRAHNAQGADEILLLDIQASKNKCPPDFKTIKAAADECFAPLTVGGGISSLDIANKCFDNGADKIFLNTSAIENPGLITKIANRFGSQAVMLGLDLYSKTVNTNTYDFRNEKVNSDIDWKEWVIEAVDRGIGEIRLMNVSQEGKRTGLELNCFNELKDIVNLPIIIEGGVGSLEHLRIAFSQGVDAIAMGTFLIFSDNNIKQIKARLISQGIEVRN